MWEIPHGGEKPLLFTTLFNLQRLNLSTSVIWIGWNKGLTAFVVLLSVGKHHWGDSHLNLIYKKYMHIKYHKMRPSVPEQTFFWFTSASFYNFFLQMEQAEDVNDRVYL